MPEVIVAASGQLLAQSEARDWQYILPDHPGSVRHVMDGTGQILGYSEYDPFGVPVVGHWASAFGYTGEQQDASGLLFLRAPYYDAGTGRFLSQDSWEGDNFRPQTLNRYGYVGANPVNLTDPSGECYGPLAWMRDTFERQNCTNPDMAYAIYEHPNAGVGERILAKGYIDTFWGSHAAGATGAAILSAKAVAASGAVQAINHGSTWLYVHGQAIAGQAVTQWPALAKMGTGLLIAASTGDDAISFGLALRGDQERAMEITAIANSDPLAYNDFLAPAAVLSSHYISEVQNYWNYYDFCRFRIIDGEVVPIGENTVYRALRPNEAPADGLHSRSYPASEVDIVSHVNGQLYSPWISTGQNYSGIRQTFDSGNGIAVIDLSLIGDFNIPNRVVDLRNGIPGRNIPRISKLRLRVRGDSGQMVYPA